MRIPDDNVPKVDDAIADDDAAIAKWAREHRKRVGWRLLAGAATIAVFAGWWLRRGVAEQGDALLIWAPAGTALAIAASIALAGVVKLVTAPPPPRSDW